MRPDWIRKAKCACGRKPIRGGIQCRRCHRESNDRWRARHPLAGWEMKRKGVLARINEAVHRGEIERGVCRCGSRKVNAHLVDWRDRGTLYWQCRKCERKEWWVRARAEGRKKRLKVRKVRVWTEEQRARMRALALANYGKMREGLRRWEEERKARKLIGA